MPGACPRARAAAMNEICRRRRVRQRQPPDLEYEEWDPEKERLLHVIALVAPYTYRYTINNQRESLLQPTSTFKTILTR